MSLGIKLFWRWFYHERSGLFLPRLLGIRRAGIELPFFLAGAFAWYLWLLTLPTAGRRFVFSVLKNPFMGASLLGFWCVGILTAYLRDRLNTRRGPRSWFSLLVPGKVLSDYTRQYGEDPAVKVLGRIRWVSLVLFFVGVCLISWNQMHP